LLEVEIIKVQYWFPTQKAALGLIKIYLQSDGTVIAKDTVPSLKFSLEEVAVVPPTSNAELPRPTSSRRRPAHPREVSRRRGSSREH
jgi:hypothetical protein